VVSAKTILGACAVVLAAATPMAFIEENQEKPVLEARAEQVLEWVTPDEKILLANLRRRPNEGDSLVNLPTLAAAPKTPEARAAALPEKRKNLKEPLKASAPEDKEQDISYDRIISLVQIGEKALKNEAPAIKVEKK
jgi:hypothetical protein